MLVNKIRSYSVKSGFTLVEMLIIAPIVILVIGIFITAIVKMTGDALTAQGANALAYNIQDSLDRVASDVKTSAGFLATNSITPLTTPQGYDNSTANFTNVGANGTMLILKSIATTNNLLSSTNGIVYLKDTPNSCASTLYNQNTPLTNNVVYFVKNNTLWRRTLMSASYLTAGCATPWQRPSCDPTITGAFCQTQDERMISNIQPNDFAVQYYGTADATAVDNVASDSSQTDLQRQAALTSDTTVSISINTTQQFAGRSVNQSGTIKATRNAVFSAVASPNALTPALSPNNGVVTTLAGSGNSIKSPEAMIAYAGNIYIADTGSNCIRKIVESTGVTTTLAGSGVAGYADGTGTAAQFNGPKGIAMNSNNGNLYVSDTGNSRIRQIITSTGVTTTLAGSGVAGYADGTGTAAQFNGPKGITFDSGSANLYVSDTGNSRIRQIVTSTGVTTTLAGSGVAGYADGTGTAAQFNGLSGIEAVYYKPYNGSMTDLYLIVADTNNNRIRQVSRYGVTTTLAGSGTAGYADGYTTTAQFNHPTGMDSFGSTSVSVLITDTNNNRIRQLYLYASSQPQVTTLAGSGTAGYTDGTGVVAQFNSPRAIAYSTYNSSSGYTYIADSGNSIRRIDNSTSNYTVITLALLSTDFYSDGTGTAARFSAPNGIVADNSGNLYVADNNNNRIRKLVISTGVVTTLAGSGVAGYADGTGAAATFQGPFALTMNGNGVIYVLSATLSRLAQVSLGGTVTTLIVPSVARAGTTIDPYGTLYFTGGFGGSSTGPTTVSVLLPIPSGTSANTYVYPTLLAGSSTVGYADGTGAAAQFSSPSGVAEDSSGNLYIADKSNNRIRKVTSGGVVTTLAGSGVAGYADGTGAAAQFNSPQGIAIDSGGNLYIADTGNNRIRKIVISTGVVTTLAGSGVVGSADGTGTAAQFTSPKGIAVDSNGVVYVADTGNNTIRVIR